jgi:16S rRNA (uracil1498-N3)-methyltransferase
VAISAVKQCGRARLPQLLHAANLAGAVSHLPEGCLVFVAHPLEQAHVPSLPPTRPQAVIVGPEGGLTDAELAAALQAGAIPLTLGRRRLRSPIAVAAGLTFLLTRLEECG